MSTPLEGILASSAVPPWLPRDAQEARKFSYWAQIIFLLMAFIWFVIGIATIATGIAYGNAGGIAWGFFGLIMSVVCGLSGIFMKRSVIDEIDHGRFNDARNASVIWLIIGIVAFVLPTILLILVYMNLSSAMNPPPAYAPYPTGAAVAQQPYQPQQYPAAQYPPSQYQQPGAPPQAAPPAVGMPPEQHKYQMVKCKNCNVQFPAFMANCPNCGAPRA
ncbi:MAG: hypothetical protein OEV21_00195 [Thermoplasmata archaeon]|nr:hypothetical protein [Thermoplasmata archaeon]